MNQSLHHIYCISNWNYRTGHLMFDAIFLCGGGAVNRDVIELSLAAKEEALVLH